MPLPKDSAPTQITIFYGTSSNVVVNLAAYNINASVVSLASFCNDFVRNVATKGYWSGLTFIPPSQITTIVAS